jgi:hypothetical protein
LLHSVAFEGDTVFAEELASCNRGVQSKHGRGRGDRASGEQEMSRWTIFYTVLSHILPILVVALSGCITPSNPLALTGLLN